MTTEIHMKTQVELAGLCSNPSEGSRNVAPVTNPEDRPAPSFDDLFEDPDPSLAPSASVPAPASFVAPSNPVQAQPEWNDDLDLPDFVTPSAESSAAHNVPADVQDEPAPARQISNVNVIGAVAPITAAAQDEAAAAVVESPAYGGPEFVAPMEDFNSGFMAPVADLEVSGAQSPAPSGRLYRSSGAEGPAAAVAIPALAQEPVRITTDPTASPAADYPPASPSARRASSSSFTSAALLEDDVEEVSSARPSKSPRRTFRISGQSAGLTYNGAVVVIMASTIIVGFIDALLNHKLGWLTGVALLASAIYAALNVRIADAWAPAILAPLGFMAATLTAGQLTRGSSGSLLIREGYMIFRSLAVNAPWIIAATVICAGIAFWRRRSA